MLALFKLAILISPSITSAPAQSSTSGSGADFQSAAAPDKSSVGVALDEVAYQDIRLGMTAELGLALLQKNCESASGTRDPSFNPFSALLIAAQLGPLVLNNGLSSIGTNCYARTDSIALFADTTSPARLQSIAVLSGPFTQALFSELDARLTAMYGDRTAPSATDSELFDKIVLIRRRAKSTRDGVELTEYPIYGKNILEVRYSQGRVRLAITRNSMNAGDVNLIIVYMRRPHVADKGGEAMGGILGSAAPPPSPVVKEAPRPVAPKRITVGGNVQQAMLVSQPRPIYPPMAKQARISGTVKFSAIIGTDGTIQNLTLLSGHPLLVQSATDAVRQWRYKPTLRNGELVEVVTQIDVNFTASGATSNNSRPAQGANQSMSRSL